jgi:hypothetical protein
MLPDQPKWVRDVIERVRPFTLTSVERIAALCHAVEYISRFNIPGSIVECGVWHGGSMMAAALTLLRFNDFNRRLYLFDTFEGMTPKTDVDRESIAGIEAMEFISRTEPTKFHLDLTLDETRNNLLGIGYPEAMISFVKGTVEDTLPGRAPDKIALLRLDTDWYESTRHELIHLYPRLETSGVLIIDDYGHYDGTRKAVDEFFEQIPIFLHRIDYTGRLVIKPHPACSQPLSEATSRPSNALDAPINSWRIE